MVYRIHYAFRAVRIAGLSLRTVGRAGNLLNDVLYDILDVYATAYLDDILVYLENEEDYVGYVIEVLERLIKVGL